MEINIIQVYKLFGFFEKARYTTENRNRLMMWPEKINSTTGFKNKKTLILPIGLQGKINEKTTELIVLQDTIDFNIEDINKGLITERFVGFAKDILISDHPPYYHFNGPSNIRNFEIFSSYKSTDYYELFFKASTINFSSGLKERDDHKIADLRKDEPVRFKVNSKNDFSLSGRMARSYWEYEYLLEYLGTAETIEFQRSPSKEKYIPAQGVKIIDERKILY